MVQIMKGIAAVIITAVIFIALFVPYAVGAMLIALLGMIVILVYFGVEAISLSKRFVLRTFYCPFRKKIVNVKLRPSIFTFRTFDDVIECSAFNTGKVT
ncbi:hypothetical protein MYX76_10690 [Desulfobacterota bacterium AH_259_B03_O07]|nr:hypothetical protein [Desulfobacterota bacterium AH_259_B03_O07]